MFVKRTFLVAVMALLVMPLPATAQSLAVEPGCPSELRGVLMVYVDARVGDVWRDRIIKEVGEKLPELIFVTTPKEAEIRLQLSFEEVPGLPHARSTGAVIKQGDADRGRLLLRVVNVRRVSRVEQAMSFAARFIKDYREANAATVQPDCRGTGS